MFQELSVIGMPKSSIAVATLCRWETDNGDPRMASGVEYQALNLILTSMVYSIHPNKMGCHNIHIQNRD
jgi:hypothetical protein